jgi:hypothetical protein
LERINFLQILYQILMKIESSYQVALTVRLLLSA